MNKLILDALAQNNQSGNLPIWLMRQAGRYLSEYQALRKKYSFLELCHNPDLIVEVTKLPIDIYGFDAAIIFSDILLFFEEFGLQVDFVEGIGPVIDPVITKPDQIRGFSLEKMTYLTDAIKTLKKELKVPLLGFSGAPFTLACYLIEGKSSKSFTKVKKWLMNDPESFHELLDLLTDYCIEHLKNQIQAGCDAVQLFDSWAGALSWGHFQEFSLKYMKKIVESIDSTPVILFCRGSSIFYRELASLRPACISLDWQGHLPTIRKEVGSSITLQGNLDPELLLASASAVEREVKKLGMQMKGDPAYICNLGHGILPTTPRENVKVLVECLKSL